MEKELIKEKVSEFMINEMEMEPAMIHDNAQLIQDIGMTSLDFVDIKAYIVRTFHFTPEAMAMKGLLTMNDLYEYIYQHQQHV